MEENQETSIPFESLLKTSKTYDHVSPSISYALNRTTCSALAKPSAWRTRWRYTCTMCTWLNEDANASGRRKHIYHKYFECRRCHGRYGGHLWLDIKRIARDSNSPSNPSGRLLVCWSPSSRGQAFSIKMSLKWARICSSSGDISLEELLRNPSYTGILSGPSIGITRQTLAWFWLVIAGTNYKSTRVHLLLG